MSFLKISALIIVIAFLGWGLFNLDRQNRRLESKVDNLNANAETLEKENRTLKENIDYFGHPENLIKELKSLFNYRQPGEKLMIIIPKKNNETR